MVIPDISLEFRELNFVILATPARTQLAELALRRAAVPRPCNLEVLQSPSFFFFSSWNFRTRHEQLKLPDVRANLLGRCRIDVRRLNRRVQRVVWEMRRPSRLLPTRSLESKSLRKVNTNPDLLHIRTQVPITPSTILRPYQRSLANPQETSLPPTL